MNRRMFLCGVTGTLAAALAAEGQPQTGKVYRIGVVVAADAPERWGSPSHRHS